MKQALHIKNLTKKYKDFTLDHISLDLPYGMILGLIGENGSGKSTLINSILNIVKHGFHFQLELFFYALLGNVTNFV